MSTADSQPIRVLVVEDDPVAADAHVMYVGRVPGFVAVGKAHTGAEARRMLDRTPVDLLLLDLHLPDVHGLQLARSLRAAGHHTDVIAVTSARDLTMVREGVSLGVVHRALATLRAPGPAALPKGLSGPTLERVTGALRGATEGLTAAGVAEAVGISRITARRYLEHLVDAGRAGRSPQYGQVGRPELVYRWVRGR